MDRPKRQAVLICITICFVAMVTGLSLQIHLMSDKSPEEHDSKHCSMCQKLLLSPEKFILEPEFVVEMAGRIECYTKSHSNICIKQFRYQQFNPRPPPAAV